MEHMTARVIAPGCLADRNAKSLAQAAQRPVDRSCLGGVIGIQHAAHFAFGDIEIAGELPPRDSSVTPGVVQGRSQGDLHRRDDHGPLLAGGRRFGQIAAFAYRGGDQLPQQIPGFG